MPGRGRTKEGGGEEREGGGGKGMWKLETRVYNIRDRLIFRFL